LITKKSPQESSTTLEAAKLPPENGVGGWKNPPMGQ